MPVPTRVVDEPFVSVAAAFDGFVDAARSPILAVVTSDTMLPSGWLRIGLGVLDRHPELALLGLDARCPPSVDNRVARTYVPARSVSYPALFRRRAFANCGPTLTDRQMDFEEWQVAQGERLVRGWLNPALPVVHLER